MSFEIPENASSLPEVTPGISTPKAPDIPSSAEAIISDQTNIHLSLKDGEALHQGVLAPSHLHVDLPTTFHDLTNNVQSVAQNLPTVLSSLHQLDEAIASAEQKPNDQTLLDLQTRIYEASTRVQLILKELQAISNHLRINPNKEDESLSGKALEESESILRTVATGLTSKAAQLENGSSSSSTIESLHMKEAAFSGLEVMASGALVCKTGYELHSLRKKLASLKKQLQKHLEANQPVMPAPSSITGQLKAKMQSLRSQPSSESHIDEPDPKIAELEKEIKQIQKKIKAMAFSTASSCIMTGANGAHFGLEITQVAAREALTHASTIASPALGLVTGPLVLVLAGKKLHSGLKEHQALSEQLKMTQDPQARVELEEKITGAKVTITRSALSIAASAIGITSSALAVAAAVGITGLSMAVAATGFGALAIGVAALAIGLGYLIYKNRAAIKAFLSQVVKNLHMIFNAKNCKQEMKTALLRELDMACFLINRTIDRTLIAHIGQSMTRETKDLEWVLAQSKKLKNQLLEALEGSEADLQTEAKKPQQA